MIIADTIVPALRGVHVAALVSLFGTLLFLALIVRTDATDLRHKLHRLARISDACALTVGVAWLVVESAVIADADNLSTTLAALPVVAFQTQYGQWFVFRCALLIAIPWLPFRRRSGLIAALTLSAVALVVQPWIGHAGAIGGNVGAELIASETLHLLAAGAWLGGLLPLFITIGILSYEAAATTCRGFTPIGLSAVLLLAGTALVQIMEFMGGLPGLFGTGYGHIALVKLALFLVLLMFAALNRLLLTERLANGTSLAARQHMRISILVEMVLGLAVIVTAGFLASSTPGTHEQPVWPFAWRPSSAAFYDPTLRGELILALIATGIGAGIATLSLIWRRGRGYLLVLALVIFVRAVPHLSWLFVQAFPTSFYTSPTEFATTAIVHGSRLYAANCAGCHGSEGHGDGPAANSLPLRPADLTAQHFWAHTDGELYWYVSHGFAAPNGGVAMPGFDGVLSSEAMWDVIDYLVAHNVGQSMRLTGKWSHPLQIPQFDAACPGDKTLDLDDLRGRLLRIVAVSDSNQDDELATVDATTITLTRRHETKPGNGVCVTTEPETWSAFAIILGQSSGTLAGWQILVDQNAWLRAAWHPGDPGDWNNPQALNSVVRDIATHPLAVSPTSGHVHRH